jgi:hypothetical protein
MNKVAKKLLSAVLALSLMLSLITVVSADADKKISVTISIERFTIGQGYLLEPTSVEVNEGASAKDVIEKVAESEGIKLNYSSYGSYLDSIDNGDTGVLNIPEQIQNMPIIEVDYGYGPLHYDAPTNTSTNILFEDNKKLGTGSYGDLAGWMYSYNNECSNNSLDAQPVADGDVIRVQFSVYAAGADLGFQSWYENIESAKLANKDALSKLVAGASKIPELNEARNAAVAVLEKYEVSQEEVDAAYTELNKAVEAYNAEKETTTEPAEKETVTNIKLDKAKIYSIKNVKRYKAKVKVKKVTNAKGYQYRYATNSEFKNSIIKTTTKRIFTTRELIKNKRCYIKVRAYRKVNGVKKYGKWSSVKSVKIKK